MAAMAPEAGALLMTGAAVKALVDTAGNSFGGGETSQAESNPLKPLADIATAPAQMLLSQYRDAFLKGLG